MKYRRSLTLQVERGKHLTNELQRPSNQLTVLDATQLHLTAYLLGDVRRLYGQIRADNVPQLEEFGYYTEKDGRFNPRGDCLVGKRYKVTKVINNNGLSSVVVLAEDLFCANRPVVLKVLHGKFYRLGIQEAHTLQMLATADPCNYAHLVRLLNTITFDSHYCLVFEPLIPVHLTSLFVKIPKHKVLKRIRQVGLRLLSSLAFIHGQNIIHADLKPDNILLKNKWDFDSVHIADFGSALKNVESEVSLYCEDFEIQTPVYRAPEVLFGKRFGQEIDIWSLGCVLAELYLGRQLFVSRSLADMVHKISETVGPFPKKVFRTGKYFEEYRHLTCDRPTQKRTLQLMKYLGCSDVMFADLVAGMLAVDPGKRLTASEAAVHPFFAAHMPLGFFLPKSDQVTNKSSMFLTEDIYPYKPEVGGAQIRKPYPTMKLLRSGTAHLPPSQSNPSGDDLKPLVKEQATRSQAVDINDSYTERKTQKAETMKNDHVGEFQNTYSREWKGEHDSNINYSKDFTINTSKSSNYVNQSDDELNGSIDYIDSRKNKSNEVKAQMRELLEAIKHEQDLVEEDLDRQAEAGAQNRTSECIVRDHHKLFRPVPRYAPTVNMTDVKCESDPTRPVADEAFLNKNIHSDKPMKMKDFSNDNNFDGKTGDLVTGDLFYCINKEPCARTQKKTPTKRGNGTTTNDTFKKSRPDRTDQYLPRRDSMRNEKHIDASYEPNVAKNRRNVAKHTDHTDDNKYDTNSRQQRHGESSERDPQYISRKRRHTDSEEYVQLLSPYHTASDSKVRKTGNPQTSNKVKRPKEQLDSFDAGDHDVGFEEMDDKNEHYEERTEIRKLKAKEKTSNQKNVQQSSCLFKSFTPEVNRNNDNSRFKSYYKKSPDIADRSEKYKKQGKLRQSDLSAEEHDFLPSSSSNSRFKTKIAQLTYVNKSNAKKGIRQNSSEEKKSRRVGSSLGKCSTNSSPDEDYLWHKHSRGGHSMHGEYLIGKPVKEKYFSRDLIECQESSDCPQKGQRDKSSKDRIVSIPQSYRESLDETYTVNVKPSINSRSENTASPLQPFRQKKMASATNKGVKSFEGEGNDNDSLSPQDPRGSPKRLNCFDESPEIIYKHPLRRGSPSRVLDRDDLESEQALTIQPSRNPSTKNSSRSTKIQSSAGYQLSREKIKRRSYDVQDTCVFQDRGTRGSLSPGYSRPQNSKTETQTYEEMNFGHGGKQEAKLLNSNSGKRQMPRSEFSFRDSPDMELEKQVAQTGIAQRIQQKSIKLKKRARKSLTFQPPFEEFDNPPCSNDCGSSEDDSDTEFHVEGHHEDLEPNRRPIAETNENVHRKHFHSNKPITKSYNPESERHNVLTSGRINPSSDGRYDDDDDDNFVNHSQHSYGTLSEDGHDQLSDDHVSIHCREKLHNNKSIHATNRTVFTSDKRSRENGCRNSHAGKQMQSYLSVKRSPETAKQLSKTMRNSQNSKCFAGKEVKRTLNRASHGEIRAGLKNRADNGQGLEVTEESWAKVVYKRKSVVNVDSSCLIDFESPGKGYSSD